MIRLADRGSVMDADFGTVIVGCIAVLVAVVIIRSVAVLRGTPWWKNRVADPARLVWYRAKAACRVLIGRPAWQCPLCARPVALEMDTCRRCTLALRSVFRSERVFDQNSDA